MESAPSPLALRATITELFPRVTPVIVGASGTVAATNEIDASDAPLSPMALLATTVHVYVLEFVSELTVIGELVSVFIRVAPPSLDAQVTV
jgi:hypothetical protein